MLLALCFIYSLTWKWHWFGLSSGKVESLGTYIIFSWKGILGSKIMHDRLYFCITKPATLLLYKRTKCDVMFVRNVKLRGNF